MTQNSSVLKGQVMADPITKKIDTLAAFTEVASGDKLLGLDVSEADPTLMTKLMSLNQVVLYNATQLSADVVETTAIKNGSVTEGKIGTGAVSLNKMASNSVDSDQYVDGSIDTVHLSNDAVTENKLGAIKRMIIIPVFGIEDAVIVKDFDGIHKWHPDLNGHVITGAWAALLGTAVSSSGPVTAVISNAGGEMCTISITQGNESAQSGTISSSYDDVSAFGRVDVNVTAKGQGVFGLNIYLEVTG